MGIALAFDPAGGVLKWLVDKISANYTAERKAKVEERGTLLASGLIAGEAIVGILLAVMFLAGISSFTRVLTGSDEFGFFASTGGWLSLLGFAARDKALVAEAIPLAITMPDLDSEAGFRQ